MLLQTIKLYPLCEDASDTASSVKEHEPLSLASDRYLGHTPKVLSRTSRTRTTNDLRASLSPFCWIGDVYRRQQSQPAEDPVVNPKTIKIQCCKFPITPIIRPYARCCHFGLCLPIEEHCNLSAVRGKVHLLATIYV